MLGLFFQIINSLGFGILCARVCIAPIERKLEGHSIRFYVGLFSGFRKGPLLIITLRRASGTSAIFEPHLAVTIHFLSFQYADIYPSCAHSRILPFPSSNLI